MLNLFIVLKGLLSPKTVLPEFSGLFYFKSKLEKNKLPNRVASCAPTGPARLSDNVIDLCHCKPFSCHCEQSEAIQRGHGENHSTGLPQSFHSFAMTAAFSLVEMLMALLVASLLLAALAPVMTRRMSDSEIKVMSEAANYDKDTVISVFTKDTNFTIPIDANQVRATIVGGGGKGGDAFYESKTFTTTQNWTVPSNVTKLRVFMVGGGGGGASGGFGTGTAYANVPAIGSTDTTITTAGSYTFADVTAPDSHKAPALPAYCQKHGTTKKWIVASDTATTVNPGAKIPKVDKQAYIRFSKVTMCGAGGGGGGNGGGGGSGGYIADKAVSSTVTSHNISIKIGAGGQSGYTGGAGGAGGGTGGAQGGGGGSAIGGADGVNGNGGSAVSNGGGGGGGGGTAIGVISSGYMIAQIGGGGAAGGHAWMSLSGTSPTLRLNFAGAGGGGGGYGSGGGGGGAHVATRETGWSCNSVNGTNGSSNGTRGVCGFSTSATDYPSQSGGNGYGGGGGGGGGNYLDNEYSLTSTKCPITVSPGNSNSGSGGGGAGYTMAHYPTAAYSYGGGGGGGAGGTGGTGGPYGKGGKLASSIFSSATNCSGGDGFYNSTNGNTSAATVGKPGAAKIWYSADAVANGLKCEYYQPSNGGGGGGAGQVWMGEIEVTPNSTITFNIGQGGSVQTIGAENGYDGTATSIVANGSTYSVSGGKGGKFENDSTYIVNSGGLGGGLKKENLGSKAIYKDWLKLGELDNNTNITGGNNGGQGYLKTSSQNGAGGNGGTSLKMDGTYYQGGNAGTDGTNGISASNANYGAGGGGGAGGIDGSFGTGGRGANGYIYIEWGGSNGGGGTAGEITQTTVTNLDGDTSKRIMKIRIGRGGGITGITSDDDSELFETSTIGSNGNGGETSINVLSGGKSVTHKARGGIKGNDGTMETNVHGSIQEFPSNYSNLYKEYILENMDNIIASGQEASGDYGGAGGYLSCLFKSKNEEGKTICNTTIKANDSTNTTAGPIRPGCGGTSILSPLYEEICNISNISPSPKGNNGTFGGGGGGGAVLNKTGGQGGNGGNGFVILEYKSTRLD